MRKNSDTSAGNSTDKSTASTFTDKFTENFSGNIFKQVSPKKTAGKIKILFFYFVNKLYYIYYYISKCTFNNIYNTSFNFNIHSI